MTEEVQNPADEHEPAPASEVTATPDGNETTPETPEAAPKVFTQEELDAAIGKRLAREQRKWEREQASRIADAQKAQAPVNPSADQFNSPEEYAEVLALRKAEQLVAQREIEKQQATILESYQDREEQARDKYDDFEQVAYNPNLPITDVMADTIRVSELGPDIAYYLGSNVKEAKRISQLTPLAQAKEIGKIEAKLSSNQPIKRITSAPEPISPVTSRSSGAPAYDTTDPRSTKTMTTSQWIEAERARQVRKLQAQQSHH